HRAWKGETGAFEGRHTTLTEQMDNPPPVQRPHPPILIGGGGERKTLKLVAKYADATHQGSGDPAVLRHKLEVLRRHCEAEGRNYDEIERYCGLELQPPRGQAGPTADASTLLERVQSLSDAGSQGVFIVLPNIVDSDSIERFGEEVIAKAG
ncbi:MAG: LLM class flavin-dependent oxidoreductase, partial [Candidatus Limnocylindria bacterium]